MRMAIQKTGPYGFGLMYHIIHLGEDVPEINAWYRKVFDADVWWPPDELNWSEIEDRYAALMAVSDLCVESMAPKQPADDRYPVGRFHLRHGSRFQSLGCMVDDIEGFARYLLDQDVYIGLPGGGRMEDVAPDMYYFYPSPRSVGGLMVQITRNTDGAYSAAVADDPRLQDDWDDRARRWSEHPLGIRRLGYATMAVRDVDATKAIFEKLLQAVPVHDGVDEGRGVRSSFVQLGHLLLEVATPLSDDGPVAEPVERFGDMRYQLTFRVDDRDAVESFLPTVGVRCARTSDAVVTANVDDCLGANYAFSTETCPGDPLA
jgi:catechol 2,3-dioxygenase-like lactoylglutathione lyase family enzyme